MLKGEGVWQRSTYDRVIRPYTSPASTRTASTHSP
jgi:hypothetical protein